MAYHGALFDLDGVLVDTAKYHYLAWKRLARELGKDFTEADNERLKGVSRMQSLEILLETCGLTIPDEQKPLLAEKKNRWYVEYLHTIDDAQLLPGVRECLSTLKAHNIKTALGSASKNAPLILQRLGLDQYLDAVIDGNSVTVVKPNPAIFLCGAQALGLEPSACVVFEDAQAGIEAAKAAGCGIVAVGSPQLLSGADMYIENVGQADLLHLFGI